MDVDTGWCEHDGRVRVTRPRFNTGPHLFMAIVTFGLWVPCWLLAAFPLRPWLRPWRCAVCGGRVSVIGSGAVQRTIADARRAEADLLRQEQARRDHDAWLESQGITTMGTPAPRSSGAQVLLAVAAALVIAPLVIGALIQIL